MKNVKFVLYIDRYAGQSVAFEYRDMWAKTLEEAIEEADLIYNDEEMYLIRIMRKMSSKPYSENNITHTKFKAILCKRSAKRGWHLNHEGNLEDTHIIERCVNNKSEKDEHWFEYASRW